MESDFVMASADLGRPMWVQTFARHYGVGIAFIQKSRDFKQTKVEGVVGNVEKKHVIIYDDMTRSASTLIGAAKAYKDKGALSVVAVLSHFALNDETIVKKLEDQFETIITTNSHPMSQVQSVKDSKKIIVLDVSETFAQFILTLLWKNES